MVLVRMQTLTCFVTVGFEWSLDLYLPYKGKTLLVAITLSHRLN